MIFKIKPRLNLSAIPSKSAERGVIFENPDKEFRPLSGSSKITPLSPNLERLRPKNLGLIFEPSLLKITPLSPNLGGALEASTP